MTLTRPFTRTYYIFSNFLHSLIREPTLFSGDSTDFHRRDRIPFDTRQAGNHVPGLRRSWNISHVRDRELLPMEDARHTLLGRPILHHPRSLLPEGLSRVLHAARSTRVG